MIVVRHSIFETNSSSTHTITLAKPTPIQRDDIPHAAEIRLTPYERPSANGHEDYNDTINYRTQMGKLRYLVHVIVSELERDVPDVYLTEFEDQFKNWQYRATEHDKKLYAEKFFAIPQFTWLCDAIHEKTNTTVHIAVDTTEPFPFWETVYDADSSLLEVFGFTEDSWNDAEMFKKIVKDIVFNDDIIIRDVDTPYCYGDDGDNITER